mgnify:CR=1 FL=1
MGPVVIVVMPPYLDNLPGVAEPPEEIFVEALVRQMKLSANGFCIGLPGAI